MDNPNLDADGKQKTFMVTDVGSPGENGLTAEQNRNLLAHGYTGNAIAAGPQTQDAMKAQRTDPANFRMPLGLPENAFQVAYPKGMIDAWNRYWDTYVHNAVDPTGGGGALVRLGPNSASYTREGQEPIFLHRGSNLNALALMDSAIAAEWKEEHGFEPIAL